MWTVRVYTIEDCEVNMELDLAKYVVDFIMGLVAIALTAKLKKVENYINQIDSAKHGVKALLRDRILNQFNKYEPQGFIPIYARENIEEMYKEYKNLGGNGAIDHLVQKLHGLPTREGD